MATVYSPPEGYDFQVSFDDDWKEKENAYIKRLRNYCKDRTNSNNDLVGELFRIPYADSHALYMVFNTKPLQLIHVPVGDAWDVPEYQTRGLRLQDIKAQVEFDKRMKKMMEKSS